MPTKFVYSVPFPAGREKLNLLDGDTRPAETGLPVLPVSPPQACPTQWTRLTHDVRTVSPSMNSTAGATVPVSGI